MLPRHVDEDLRSLRLSLRTILVTTEDALRAMEGRDPLAVSAARERASKLLEPLRSRVEAAGDPDLHALYREAWRLIGEGWVLVAGLAGITS